MQSEPYKKQKRRLNVYLTKSRIIYGTNHWWQYTPKLEPISSVNTESCKLSPNA